MKMGKKKFFFICKLYFAEIESEQAKAAAADRQRDAGCENTRCAAMLVSINVVTCYTHSLTINVKWSWCRQERWSERKVWQKFLAVVDLVFAGIVEYMTMDPWRDVWERYEWNEDKWMKGQQEWKSIAFKATIDSIFHSTDSVFSSSSKNGKKSILVTRDKEFF